jgi:hypothetical protein
MLKCSDIAQQGSDYLERRQTWRQRMAVGLHLLLCGNCRDFIRHLRTSLTYYRQLPPKELGEEDANALARKITGKDG